MENALGLAVSNAAGNLMMWMIAEKGLTIDDLDKIPSKAGMKFYDQCVLQAMDKMIEQAHEGDMTGAAELLAGFQLDYANDCAIRNSTNGETP